MPKKKKRFEHVKHQQLPATLLRWCILSNLKVIAQPQIRVHDVYARVIGHNEAIRKMKIAEQAQAQTPSLVHFDLYAHS
jgi:hypothetical protein